MASPSALTLPAAAPARHFPISRRGRRVPRRQHPTGPLGGRDVRPCAGARSAARSGRASIVARDGPGLTISTVMDVLKRLVIKEHPTTTLEEWLCAAWQRRKSATLVRHASVAQGIEHRSPKAGVDGSNPPGGTREFDGVARAAPFLVCGTCRRIRTVDTRVTHFPAGGVFESARGHQRTNEPGTATVPGSSGLRAGFGPSTPASPISPRGGEFSNPPGGTREQTSPVPPRCRALLVKSHLKNKEPACRGSKRALLSEYVCGVRPSRTWR